ncbi:MAG: hypothetical protein EP326_05710 [Deltaproteobacteria bacterium]|nr:MAG: hypothetical protein EP326_05710 [Deltaproteobacteria bacterium]TNF27655.1 MAG: hypothetical protein EP319_10875 [Deltaproteobacteria bacterium]
MNKEKQKLTDDNLLVMFPASKNFPVEELSIEDPLEELLLEFSHFQDEDFEDDDDIYENAMQAEALMVEDILKKNQHQNELLRDQMNLLEETSMRMKYLLDEIELYLPKKR